MKSIFYLLLSCYIIQSVCKKAFALDPLPSPSLPSVESTTEATPAEPQAINEKNPNLGQPPLPSQPPLEIDKKIEQPKNTSNADPSSHEEPSVTDQAAHSSSTPDPTHPINPEQAELNEYNAMRQQPLMKAVDPVGEFTENNRMFIKKKGLKKVMIAERAQNQTSRIQDLSFSKIFLIPSDSLPRSTLPLQTKLFIQGIFYKPHWLLFAIGPSSTKVQIEFKNLAVKPLSSPKTEEETETLKNNNFQISFVYHPFEPIQFIAISPEGLHQEETIRFVPKSDLDKLKNNKHHNHFFTAGLGLTQATYNESYNLSLKQINITGELAYTYISHMRSKWIFTSTVFGTLMELTRNIPSKSARYLSGHAQVGYKFQPLDTDWQFDLFLGMYYNTMIVPDKSFGYSNMYGPQIYPKITKRLSQNDSITLFLKYAAIVDQGIHFSQSYETGAGMIWNNTSSKLHAITLDLTQLNLKPRGYDVSIQGTSITLGFSIKV